MTEIERIEALLTDANEKLGQAHAAMKEAKAAKRNVAAEIERLNAALYVLKSRSGLSEAGAKVVQQFIGPSGVPTAEALGTLGSYPPKK
jgi:hypothetical protein